MKIKKTLLACLLLTLTVLGIIWAKHAHPPILQESIHSENFGDIAVAQPLWGSQGLALVFADTQKFPATALGQRLAATGMTAAVVDPGRFFQGFNAESGQCLDDQRVATSIDALLKELPVSSVNHLLVAGIAEGALIPFINAQSPSKTEVTNLSIGFSVALPNELVLCPPLLSHYQNQKHSLVSSPSLEGNWRSVWTDQPPDETAVFIKALGNVDTWIAAYDTPLDALLIDEVNTALGKSHQFSPPMPVVEVPVTKPGDNVTIFYSGDGGWRDLDRTVAGEMAAINYPVVGVDVLRYFWERKTPEQAAADLATTMAYYRKNWAVKSFVLAGYSFGADILPAIYNRLPQQDKDSIRLLVLIALANSADFEIHVSGWLGQISSGRSLAPELAQIPRNKILCIYGKEEKAETACTKLLNSEANILELPGGHHFDQDYPKLTKQILDVYRQHGIGDVR
ncbi:virulence factor family protein [Methylobacter sp.]|uniref:virulence factor family protein n=1 Tax=Methylobacter sp. TaxID=2051955 RepID=UPI002FDD234D